MVRKYTCSGLVERTENDLQDVINMFFQKNKNLKVKVNDTRDSIKYWQPVMKVKYDSEVLK